MRRLCRGGWKVAHTSLTPTAPPPHTSPHAPHLPTPPHTSPHLPTPPSSPAPSPAPTHHQVIRVSLDELARALRGEVVMSGELERVAHALSAGKVPELWLGKSFPSLKPLGSYVKELLERVAFFDGWLHAGPPTVYWISGFFFTQVR